MEIKIQPFTVGSAFKSYSSEKQKKSYKSDVIKVLAPVSLLGLVCLWAYCLPIKNKKPPRKTFEELLKEKELNIKNDLMFDKLGNKFSGILARSTGEKGKNGHEMIETQVYKNGLLEEKTYKDRFNNELMGYFYKNGKIVSHVDITGSGKNRVFAFSRYNKDGRCVTIGDGLSRDGKSIFETFRINKEFV